MKILHVCNSSNTPFSGINVVIPQHVQAQHVLCKVSVLNLYGLRLDCDARQITEKEFYSEVIDYDVVVFHGVYFFKYIKIGKILARQNIPYIVVPHCSLTKISLSQKKIKKTIANYLFFFQFLKKASAIQFLSDNEKETSLFSSKGFVCGNGVSLKKSKKIWDNDICLNKFIYVGRFDTFHKGIDLLFDAIALERDFLKEKKFILDLYGPRKMDSSTNACCAQETLLLMAKERGIENLVFIHDAIYGDEKFDVMKEYDFFIQSSRFEGLPLGVLEALSLGLPCVVTKGTNLSDKINEFDAGWGVETSPRAVADAIKNAMKCSKFVVEKKSSSALKLIESCYTWPKIAEKEIDCYRKTIAK